MFFFLLCLLHHHFLTQSCSGLLLDHTYFFYPSSIFINNYFYDKFSSAPFRFAIILSTGFLSNILLRKVLVHVLRNPQALSSESPHAVLIELLFQVHVLCTLSLLHTRDRGSFLSGWASEESSCISSWTGEHLSVTACVKIIGMSRRCA